MITVQGSMTLKYTSISLLKRPFSETSAGRDLTA